MIQGYLVTVGFDWQVSADPDTGLRPLELYLVEHHEAGDRIGTFSRLQAEKTLTLTFFDLTAPATLATGSTRQLEDQASYRPISGTVKFRSYEIDSTQPDTSPLSEATIDFGNPGDAAYLRYAGINSSLSLASGVYHTWRLENAPQQLEHVGRFGISIQLEVEEKGAADGSTRSFFVDPEVIVEGDG